MNTDSIYQELTFIQGCISRMAWNAWFLKGCAVAVFISAVLSAQIALIIPILVFWGLDAYFLRLERMYRRLYDWVRHERQVDNMQDWYSLNPSSFANSVDSWRKTALSATLVPFYASLIVVVCLV